MNRMCGEVCEYSKPIEEIISKIGKEMDVVRNLYVEAAQEEDRLEWRGKWRGLIDAYIIAVEVLAEIKKELKE